MQTAATKAERDVIYMAQHRRMEIRGTDKAKPVCDSCELKFKYSTNAKV